MDQHPESGKDVFMFDPDGIPLFFGIAVYALEGNTMILYYHD